MFDFAKRKGQSAIEYLMTYGWAILIIGIVLAVLFKLNVFSGQTFVSSQCNGIPGFPCSTPVLNQSGLLSITIGQVGSSPIYDVMLSCSASFNTSGEPSNASSWTLVQSNGIGIPISQLAGRGESPINGTVMVSGQNLRIKGIPCYGSSGEPMASPSAIDTAFTGALWINYTNTACTPRSAGCNPNIEQIATLQLKVV